jgi:type IX secretion system PorP/SprF family membrane protein
MNRACFKNNNTTKHKRSHERSEQDLSRNLKTSCMRPLKNNFVRMKHYFPYIFLIIAGLFPCKKVFAQADISMAAYWYNRANYNPAFIVRPDYLYLFCDFRQQWVGVKGAPQVFNVQASEFIRNLHSAFGLSLTGDKIGVTQAYNPMFSYAYKIIMDRGQSISMGLSLGVFSRVVNGASFDAENTIDPSLYTDRKKFTQFDANVGFEYQSEHFIAGASSTHLQSIVKRENSFINTNHRYGYFIYKNTDLNLFNYYVGLNVINRQNITICGGNANLRFKRETGDGAQEMFDIGFSYNTTKQMVLMLGLNIGENLKIGYAFLQSYGIGYNRNRTHEIMCEFRIPSKKASERFKSKKRH